MRIIIIILAEYIFYRKEENSSLIIKCNTCFNLIYYIEQNITQIFIIFAFTHVTIEFVTEVLLKSDCSKNNIQVSCTVPNQMHISFSIFCFFFRLL